MTLPNIAVGMDLDTLWHDAVAEAVNIIQARTAISGPAALTLATNVANYGGGYQEAQVMRFGPLVVCNGLIKWTSATAGSVNGSLLVATVPSGYRPRPTGASSPIGGKTVVHTLSYTGVSPHTPSRIDVLDGSGQILFVHVNGTTGTWPQNGWLAINTWWIGE